MPDIFDLYGKCPYCNAGGGMHLPGCPEHEPAPVGRCSLCGEDIYPGEKIVWVEDDTMHTECFLQEYEEEAE